MASSSRADTSGVTRKLILLAVAIVVAVALYTGGWFYAASQLKERITQELAATQQGMHAASCTDMSVRGFPFRIGIFCGSVGLDDRPAGLSASFGAIRLMAPASEAANGQAHDGAILRRLHRAVDRL